jgi:hypothetical protein
MNFPLIQKSIIFLRNNFTKNQLEMVGYDFVYELIDHIAIGNGSVIFKGSRVLFFRD